MSETHSNWVTLKVDKVDKVGVRRELIQTNELYFFILFFLLSSQWGLVSSTLSTLSTFAQRDGVKKKEPVPEFVLEPSTPPNRQ